YVESLHQNTKSQIIYGKNHVIVIQREKDIAGYLSLHLTSSGLVLKWTPNQIMNGCNSLDDAAMTKTKTGYWDYALNIDFNTIVYLHCHQQESAGATIVLVAQDGVQYPPIIFPKGSHLLQFLTCLETGLAPNGLLDPALWNDDGKGKIFPKIPRKTVKNYKSDAVTKTESQSLDEMEESQEDFVFRIINSKSNVTMVNSEPVNKRKLEFSLSAGNKSDQSHNAIFFEKMSYNKNKLGFLLSSWRIKNSSMDECQPNNGAKAPSPSLTSQFSVFSSIDSNHCSISPSSIVLDKTSTNGFSILSKVENIQQHSINNFESMSTDLNTDNLTNLKQISSSNFMVCSYFEKKKKEIRQHSERIIYEKFFR
ncbi:small G signaling modulator 1, partial [Brachionus plicatilis]